MKLNNLLNNTIKCLRIVRVFAQIIDHVDTPFN